jgi:hypothetical protein
MVMTDSLSLSLSLSIHSSCKIECNDIIQSPPSGDLVFRTRVISVERYANGSGYLVRTHDQNNEECMFLAKSVINSAGLYSDQVLFLLSSLLFIFLISIR